MDDTKPGSAQNKNGSNGKEHNLMMINEVGISGFDLAKQLQDAKFKHSVREYLIK